MGAKVALVTSFNGANIKRKKVVLSVIRAIPCYRKVDHDPFRRGIKIS